MNAGPGPRPERSLEVSLTARGRTITLHVTGRSSGQPREATVGFVEGEDGSLLVAAASEATHWARNLAVQPRCRVERGEISWICIAVPLQGAEAHAAVAALILKYGTPAERLGSGPVYRLVPVDPPPTVPPAEAGR